MSIRRNKRLVALIAASASTFGLIGTTPFAAPHTANPDDLSGNPVAPTAVPLGLSPVPIPASNPQTAAKIELGRRLYFDTRLSGDGTLSCASCHSPTLGWTDRRPTSKGIDGHIGGRNAPSIINAAYHGTQFWDGRAASLEEQALGPIENPIEMGSDLTQVVNRLSENSDYTKRFEEVFGTQVTREGIGKAIAAFERTIISGNSPYDRYEAGDESDLNEAQKRGMELFMDRANCAVCHTPPTFSNGRFYNAGVGMGEEEPDPGRMAVTKRERDFGRFRVPSLREVKETGPYFHDGSAATLEEAVALMAGGGIDNPNLSSMFKVVRLANLTEQDQSDLVEFLKALSGEYPVIEPPQLLGESNKVAPIPVSPDGAPIDPEKDANEFLQRMLASAGSAKGENVTVRFVLDEVSKKIDAGALGKGTEVEAAVRTTIGRTYRAFRMFDAAQPHLVGALDIRKRVLGKSHIDTLASMSNLGRLYWGQGRYAEAEALFSETMEIRRTVLGEDHPDTLDSMARLAAVLRNQRQTPQAEQLFLDAIDRQGRVLGDDHPDTLRTISNFAGLYSTLGGRHFDKAEQLYLETLAGQRRVLGDDHTDTITTKRRLASLYRRQGRYDESEPLYLQALEAQRRVGGGDTWILWILRGQLANIYIKQRRYDEAEPLLLENQADAEGDFRVPAKRRRGTIHHLVDLYEAWGQPVKADTWRAKLNGEQSTAQLGGSQP